MLLSSLLITSNAEILFHAPMFEIVLKYIENVETTDKTNGCATLRNFAVVATK